MLSHSASLFNQGKVFTRKQVKRSKTVARVCFSAIFNLVRRDRDRQLFLKRQIGIHKYREIDGRERQRVTETETESYGDRDREIEVRKKDNFRDREIEGRKRDNYRDREIEARETER